MRNDDPALTDDTIPLRNEPCAECGNPIATHVTAVQVRQAGEESCWCCSWACVKRFVGKATETTGNQRYILLNTLGMTAVTGHARTTSSRNPTTSVSGPTAWPSSPWATCAARRLAPKPPEVEFNATVDGVQQAMGIVQRERIERWLATGEWTRRERGTMTKVYLRGGPLNTHLQDVAEDATSWTHFSLCGHSEDNLRSTLEWLAGLQKNIVSPCLCHDPRTRHRQVGLRAERRLDRGGRAWRTRFGSANRETPVALLARTGPDRGNHRGILDVEAKAAVAEGDSGPGSG